MTCKRCGHRLFAVGDLELHQQVLYGMRALNAARRCRCSPFLLCACCFCKGAHSKHVRAARRAMATSSATANKSRCTARGHRSNREHSVATRAQLLPRADECAPPYPAPHPVAASIPPVSAAPLGSFRSVWLGCPTCLNATASSPAPLPSAAPR